MIENILGKWILADLHNGFLTPNQTWTKRIQESASYTDRQIFNLRVSDDIQPSADLVYISNTDTFSRGALLHTLDTIYRLPPERMNTQELPEHKLDETITAYRRFLPDSYAEKINFSNKRDEYTYLIETDKIFRNGLRHLDIDDLVLHLHALDVVAIYPQTTYLIDEPFLVKLNGEKYGWICEGVW